jgi:hypothetical protein
LPFKCIVYRYTTAMGLGNGLSRIGGMTCPLFAVEMVAGGNLAAAAGFFAGLALVTAGVAFWLPVETAGKKPDVEPDGGGGGGGGGGSWGVPIVPWGTGSEGGKVGDVKLSAAARGCVLSSRY